MSFFGDIFRNQTTELQDKCHYMTPFDGFFWISMVIVHLRESIAFGCLSKFFTQAELIVTETVWKEMDSKEIFLVLLMSFSNAIDSI